jgi:hypothetical protein
MKTVGFILDAVLIVLSITSFVHSPIVRKLTSSNDGLISAISCLPSSAAGSNSSSHGVSPWATMLKDSSMRASYEYILGNDLFSDRPSSSTHAVPAEQQKLFHDTGIWINSLVLPQAVRDVLPSAVACKYSIFSIPLTDSLFIS